MPPLDVLDWWQYCTVILFCSPFVFSFCLDLVRGKHELPKKAPVMSDENTPARIPLTEVELERPKYAWPTVLLSVVVFALWANNLRLFHKGQLELLPTVLMNAVFAFISFTPVHDASHSAISKPGSEVNLNFIIGCLSAIPLVAPFQFFKYMHGQHHRFNNHPTLDPDHWCAHPSKNYFRGGVELLFKCSTAFFYYLHVFRARLRRECEEETMSRTIRNVYSELKVYVVVLGVVIYMLRETFFLAWLLPALIALTFLMYAFDFLPHRAHAFSDRQNPYKATNFTRGILDPSEPTWVHSVLGILLLNQDIHLVHHLYPFIPWYKYPVIYQHRREEMIRKGAREIPILDLKGLQFEEKHL